VPLAERGLAVTAVELGAALAARARVRTAGFPLVSIVTSSFENWQDTSAIPVRAVAVFNALHWIDPGMRYAKPTAILAPEGVMVVGSCRWARPTDAEPFWAKVQEDYRAVGFPGAPPPPPEQIGTWHFPDEARAYFGEVASFRHPFQWSCTAADYLAQLSAQSGTRSLGPYHLTSEGPHHHIQDRNGPGYEYGSQEPRHGPGRRMYNTPATNETSASISRSVHRDRGRG